MASTPGSRLIERLHDGSLAQAPSESLRKTRDDISLALEEMIDVGARIRRLTIGGKQVGWVRGVHLNERKRLSTWLADDVEVTEHVLRIGTTLSPEYLRGLSMAEMRSLARVVRIMTESDLRLYPYTAAFTSTSVSEHLWFSRGIEATRFHDRLVTLPDGQQMKLLVSSEQARLWASLCQARVHARERLDAASNAVLIVRPWVGKGADQLNHRITTMARGMQTDSFEPWKDLIHKTAPASLTDGWAHAEDDSFEGMRRELHGMFHGDKHEQWIEAWGKKLRDDADRHQREMEARIAQRVETEPDERGFTVLTEEQVQDQMRAFQATRPTIAPPMDLEMQSSLEDRLAKY